jgi:hypothetical protein
MTALTKQNISDLVALQLEGSGLAEQVTSLELLELFETVAGFWPACVAMITPTSEDLSAIHGDQSRNGEWFQGSMEHVQEAGIRDGSGKLTPAFCDWFERFCIFDLDTRTRTFLAPHTRPTDFVELGHIQTQDDAGENGTADFRVSSTKNAPKQMQTKFAEAVIGQMNIPADTPASEAYPSFVSAAIRLVDNGWWAQGLTAESQSGTGYLVVTYTTTGPANSVSKTLTPKRFAELLLENRRGA